MKPYHYVYNRTQGRGPRVQHPTLAEAQAEALRLASQHPGDTFEILKCVGLARTTEPSVFWNDGEEPAPPTADHYPTTPLPEGFDRWVCRGLGWEPGREVWFAAYNAERDSWDITPCCRKPVGFDTLEYWEAVKDEESLPTDEPTDDSYPTTPPNPGPGFRILEPGEQIPRGAEAFTKGGVWKVNTARGWDGDTFDPESDLWFRVPVRQTLQLRVGGRYLDRRDREVMIDNRMYTTERWPFSGSNGQHYHADGSWSIDSAKESEHDLVREIVEEPLPTYRMLVAGEVIRDGDERLDPDGEWHPVFPGAKGETLFSMNVGRFRRPINL